MGEINSMERVDMVGTGDEVPDEWVPHVSSEDAHVYMRVRRAYAAEELRERLTFDYLLPDSGWKVSITRADFDLLAGWLEDDLVQCGEEFTGDHLHCELIRRKLIEEV